MKNVPFACPTSLGEALEALAATRGARVIAGGTDLLVRLDRGAPPPPLLVSLHAIEGLDLIELEGATLRLGARVSLAQLARDERIAEAAPLLRDAARSMASPPVRTRGTIGGNLCNASPAADLAPPLLVHEARVVLTSARGARELPLAEFLLGPGETALGEAELMTEIIVPALPEGMHVGHGKHQVGVCGNLSIVSLAVGLSVEGEERTCRAARIALGAVAPRATRYGDVEAKLIGRALDSQTIKKAADLAGSVCSPIDDVRASCDHRCHLVAALLPRVIGQALSRAAE